MNILSLLNNSDYTLLLYKKGETLFHEQDICNCICIILSGSIKISSFTSSGKEVIYNILNENDLFGNHLIFSSEPTYKGDVIANDDSKVIMIQKEKLIELLVKNPDFLLEFLKIQSDFSKELNFKIKLLSLDNIKDRFIYFLEKKGPYTYHSVTDLARQLNVERETLSRLISKMCKEKELSRIHKTISLL